MADFSAAERRRHRGAAGVGEEVQHPFPVPRSPFHNPLPLRSLLWKYAEVAEVGTAELELYARSLNRPFLRKIGAAMPAVAVLAVERRVCAIPLRLRSRRTPERLRARTRKHVLAEALQLSPVARIKKLVVVFHQLPHQNCQLPVSSTYSPSARFVVTWAIIAERRPLRKASQP